MIRVTIAELQSQLTTLLRAAEAGEVIEVLDRAQPIARLVPVRGAEGLELIPSRRPFSIVRRVHLPALRQSMTSLEALQKDRGSR